jgi:microcystin-dependent protein
MRQFHHRVIRYLPFQELTQELIMSEPFVAEIRIFAGNFAPRGWAFCNGQLLPIAQNTALFSLIGTTYGGNGRTTMGLPNLRERAPMHPGSGPGLTGRRLGETGGAASVALTVNQIPAHNHLIRGSLAAANTGKPYDATDVVNSYRTLADTSPDNSYAALQDQEALAADALTDSGGSQAHNNMQPYLGLNFIIALVGLYPSRG